MTRPSTPQIAATTIQRRWRTGERRGHFRTIFWSVSRVVTRRAGRPPGCRRWGRSTSGCTVLPVCLLPVPGRRRRAAVQDYSGRPFRTNFPAICAGKRDGRGERRDRRGRPRYVVAELVIQRPRGNGREAQPDHGDPAEGGVLPGHQLAPRVERDRVAGQGGLQHRPAGFRGAQRAERGVLGQHPLPAGLPGGVRGLVDDQLGAAVGVHPGHVGERRLEADQHTDLERRAAGRRHGHARAPRSRAACSAAPPC